MDRLFQLKVSEFAIRNGYTITVSEYDEGRFSSLDEIPVSSLEMKDHILKIHVAPDDLDLLYFIDKKTFPEWMKNLQIDAFPPFLNNHFDQTTQYTIYELVLCMKRFHVIPQEPQLAGYMTLIPEPEVPDETQLNADIEAHKKVNDEVLKKDPRNVNPHDLAREKEEVSHRTIYLKSLKAENKAILARRDEVVKQNEEIKKRNKLIEQHNQELKNHYEEVMDVFRETEAFVGLLLYRRAKSMRGYTFKDAKQRLRLFSSRNAPKRALVEDVLIPKSPPNKYIKMEACGHSAGHVHHHVMPVVPPSPPRRSSSPPTPPPTPPPVVVVETKTPDTPPPDVKETKKPDTPPPPVVDTNKPDTPPLPTKNLKDPVVPEIPVIPTKPPVPPRPWDKVLEEMKKGKTLNKTDVPDVIIGDGSPFITDGLPGGVAGQLINFRDVFNGVTTSLREYLTLQRTKAAIVIWQCMCVLWFHTMVKKLRAIRDVNEDQKKFLVNYFGEHIMGVGSNNESSARKVGKNEKAFYASLEEFNMDQIILQILQQNTKVVVDSLTPEEYAKKRKDLFNKYFPRILRLSFFPIDMSCFTAPQEFLNEIDNQVSRHNTKDAVRVFNDLYLILDRHEQLIMPAIIAYNSEQKYDNFKILKSLAEATTNNNTNGVEDVTMDASI